MDNDVIGVADNPANRYFDPLTSPTPRTSTDAPQPGPVTVPPPAQAPEPAIALPQDPPPQPARERPRQPTPPPPPPSAFLYGHDYGLFTERLGDSDETFAQWAARKSHADNPIRHPTELRKGTLPQHMVRAARFVHDGHYEVKRAMVRARVRRTKTLLDGLFGAGVLAVVMAAVGMGAALKLRAEEWDTFAQLARWTIAAFALAGMHVLGIAVSFFKKNATAQVHIFLLKCFVPFYVLFIIPALGTGVAALPVGRGVGADAYATRGILLAYISAGGFISAAMAVASIAASVLIIYDDNRWYRDVSREKLKLSAPNSYTTRDHEVRP